MEDRKAITVYHKLTVKVYPNYPRIIQMYMLVGCLYKLYTEVLVRLVIS